ncbi:putative LEU5-mitochondrial coenzyme A transporter-member of the mitochondrial carrier family [Desarmillaria ectypa]|nr:putative LEU5-mitochondrial coenzyme A transporter-member of the mitochondrial carrier family [Desarmillaria ectypa]
MSTKISKTDYYFRSALAGGFAGGVAKTAVAPLERIKILFQTQNREFTRFSGSWRGAYNALEHIVRTQGFLALYRGNSLTLSRAVPHAALGYTVYDTASKILMPTPSDQTSFRRLIAGSIAGVSALPITYPFELLRVRMAVATQHSSLQPTILTLIRNVYGEHLHHTPLVPGGLRNFYRGFVVTLAGTVPYRGGIFLVWETLNQYSRERLSSSFRAANQHKLHLIIGAIAGTTAQIATYPLEVVRRIQQASGHASGSQRAFGIWEMVVTIQRTSGWRGFYTGLGIGLVKQVPMHSISLSVWQAAKKLLDI